MQWPCPNPSPQPNRLARAFPGYGFHRSYLVYAGRMLRPQRTCRRRADRMARMSVVAEFALAPHIEHGFMSPEPARFRLDAANRCLWLRNHRGSGERIPLTPKAFAVVRHLVECASHFAISDSGRADALSSRFRRVLAYINDNLDRSISLVELASIMGLSPSRFSHVFKIAHGIAPYRYILRRRIEAAKARLCNCDATIATISWQVGFSSESRFRQIFVRYTGATPSAYRATRGKR